MGKENKTVYIPPKIELIEIVAEKGFTLSSDTKTKTSTIKWDSVEEVEEWD